MAQISMRVHASHYQFHHSGTLYCYQPTENRGRPSFSAVVTRCALTASKARALPPKAATASWPKRALRAQVRENPKVRRLSFLVPVATRGAAGKTRSLRRDSGIRQISLSAGRSLSAVSAASTSEHRSGVLRCLAPAGTASAANALSRSARYSRRRDSEVNKSSHHTMTCAKNRAL